METPVLPSYVTVFHPTQPGYFRMPATSEENVQSAMEYQARSGDLFICSYPKCGSTWLHNIVWRILHGGEEMPGNIRDCVPLLEFDGGEEISEKKSNESFKIIKTHFPYRWVPKHPESKCLFIAREPKDVCVSLYYHIKGFKEYKWSDGRFEDLAEAFVKGECDACDYYEMLDEWFQVGDSESVHIVLYEEMIKDPRKEIFKLAEFLGPQWIAKLVANDDAIIHDVIKNTSVAKMKSEDSKWHKTARTLPFVRKGIVGDWKNHMTPEQAELFDCRTEKLVEKYSILKCWSVGLYHK